jgi:hypothetical protein
MLHLGGSEDFEIRWNKIVSGGGTSTGGINSLSVRFWGRFVGWLYELFLPLIMR